MGPWASVGCAGGRCVRQALTDETEIIRLTQWPARRIASSAGLKEWGKKNTASVDHIASYDTNRQCVVL